MADEPLNDLGDDCRFMFAYQVAIELAFVVFMAFGDWDFETGDGRAIGRSRAGCCQGRETGLSGRLRQEGLETAIGKFEDRSAGTEIRRDLEDAVRVLREKSALCHQIGVNVGAAEAVDRLLGVSHQKQAAGPQPASSPRLAPICVSAQEPEDFGLQGIGILKLVDQDAGIAPGEGLSHGGIMDEQIARVME
jgi:hypothetical protein